jgi:hypothetical protein
MKSKESDADGRRGERRRGERARAGILYVAPVKKSALPVTSSYASRSAPLTSCAFCTIVKETEECVATSEVDATALSRTAAFGDCN